MMEKANVIWLDESDRHKSNVIYMLIFPNWKYYIGQTRTLLYHRIYRHSWIQSSNRKISNAIRKYKTFHVMVLDNCKDLDELNVREQYWIELYDTFNNGYNSTTGGYACENITSTRVYKPLTEYQINKQRSSILEFYRINGSPMKDVCKTKEHRENISKNKKGRNLYSDNKNSIKCKSMPDNIIFDSIKRCVEYYSIDSMFYYLDKNKVHKKSGQTFVRLIN